MSEEVLTADHARIDRRQSQPTPLPTFGELLVDFSWRPSDRPRVDSLAWLVAHGYAPERRKRAS
jgi:hypothetical protein